jgi:hypothetical protein|nr:MAG TPA_asm: NAD-dependent DNA ligase C4 zinc finger domain [Caudoviricetes sp.]
MAFWKKKKYCQYCGSELKADGGCSNPNCIAYKTGDTVAGTTTTESKEA